MRSIWSESSIILLLSHSSCTRYLFNFGRVFWLDVGSRLSEDPERDKITSKKMVKLQITSNHLKKMVKLQIASKKLVKLNFIHLEVFFASLHWLSFCLPHKMEDVSLHLWSFVKWGLKLKITQPILYGRRSHNTFYMEYFIFLCWFEPFIYFFNGTLLQKTKIFIRIYQLFCLPDCPALQRGIHEVLCPESWKMKSRGKN